MGEAWRLHRYHRAVPAYERCMVTLADGTAIHWGYSPHTTGGATLSDPSTASYPDGTNESYARDASGNLTNFTDPVGTGVYY